MLRKILPIIIILLLSNTTIYADNHSTTENEQGSTNPDLTLFVEDGMLTLYVSHNEATSLEGFQFLADQGGELTEFSLETRFIILPRQNYSLLPGTCLVYRFDQSLEQPDSCNDSLTIIVPVGPGDRFWLNENEERQAIYFLKNGEVLPHWCSQLLNECPIYYNVGRPVIDLSVEPERPEWPEFSSQIGITPAFKKNSNRGFISDIIVSPDNEFIVSAHSTGEICIWSNDGFEASPANCFSDETTQHDAGITALEINPYAEGFEFATIGNDGFARIWSIDVRNEITLVPVHEETVLNHGEPINDLSWNPESNKLAVVGAERITIWNFEGTLPQSISGSNYVEIDWRDDRYMAAIDSSGLLRIIDTQTEDINVIDNYTVRIGGLDVLWNRANNDLVSVTNDGAVRIYNSLILPPECYLCDSHFIAQNINDIREVSISPNNELIAIAAGDAIHVLNAQFPFTLVDRYVSGETSSTSFSSVAWAGEENNQLIASNISGTLFFWDIESGSPSRLSSLDPWSISPSLPSEVLGLAWDPDGELIGVVDSNLNLSIFDTTGILQGNSIAHKDRPLAIDWHPTNNVIATGGCGPSIKIWEENALARDIINQADSGSNCITDLDFDPTGQYLVSTNQAGILNVWSWSSESEITFRDIGLTVTQVVWDNTGTQLAFVDDSGSFQIFNFDSNNLRETLVRQPVPGVSLTSLAWSPDGNYVATASEEGWIAVWDTQDDNIRANSNFEGSFLLEGHDAAVISVSWSSQNNWLVSAGLDNRVIVWDALTGQRLAEIETGTTLKDAQWVPTAPGIAVGDISGNITLYIFDFAQRLIEED